MATSDGRAPTPDPFGLESRFHYDDADEDFLSSVVRSFAPDAESIRITLHQLTELGMIGARRIVEVAVEQGADPSLARDELEAAARSGWYHDRSLVDELMAASAAVGYGSVSHFINEFKRTFGETPRSYADRFREVITLHVADATR